MYHRVRRKMQLRDLLCIVLLLHHAHSTHSMATTTPKPSVKHSDDYYDNNIIDFDDDYQIKFHKKYGDWRMGENFDKNAHKYTVIKDEIYNVTTTSEVPMEIATEMEGQKNTTDVKKSVQNVSVEYQTGVPLMQTTEADISVIPLELLSTTEDSLSVILDSTTEPDLTVIPLKVTEITPLDIGVNDTVTSRLPSSTLALVDDPTTDLVNYVTTENVQVIHSREKEIDKFQPTDNNKKHTYENTTSTDDIHTNSSEIVISLDRSDHLLYNDTQSEESELPIFTALDLEDHDVPEDYYDSKDLVPTKPPSTDALSVIFGLAGSVVESMVESVAERVVPKGIYDLFKRMQRQNEALEAERLRSREENGGLGQFGRGILKSISSGLSKPLSQLMGGASASASDKGSLDSDRGFVASLASGVSSVASVATSLVDSFKDRVQAIYPGTMWCGDGHSAAARSGGLGLFFFTDTCCRQHDACKLYIRAGETKYGLTNTGLFTRSHCSCDARFRTCLQQTNSLISAQIGLTYFNVLGPQCFRRAHPILRCVRRTRITGQKCEEYELDYGKPKMWQWFDNETF